MNQRSADGVEEEWKETPWEGLAGICSVLVIGLFILTLIGQNMVIPSGSMQNTLLIGDHVMVDRITFAPPAKWMPLMHYREPKRGDVVVFFKPAMDPTPDGGLEHSTLVKRLIACPGDHVHLRAGVIYINGVAQKEPYVSAWPNDAYAAYEDEFPSVSTTQGLGVTEEWAVALPGLIQGEDLVVPAGMYFMMGDHRHKTLDSRFWGLVPRENIIGRPIFNYWSFETPDTQMDKTTLQDKLAWMTHVAIHFFSDTRWSRTFHLVR